MTALDEMVMEPVRAERNGLDPDKQIEIVNGLEEEKEMAGAKHGGTGLRLGAEIWLHVKANRLGRVYGPDTTFTIGSNDRMPDISFVSAARIPPAGEPAGKWGIAPDLVVEIVSPNDLYLKIKAKIREYFAAGVRQVWLVSPEERIVTVYDSPAQSYTLTDQDELDSPQILPGFRCALAEIFLDPPETT
jgi:Uma2 family endonuclease